MYVLFLIILLSIFLFNLVVYKFEILSPPVLLSFMFFFCAFVGIIRYDDWRLNEYYGFTVLVIVSGILAFCLGGYFGSACRLNYLKKNEPIRHDRIELDRLCKVVFIIIGISGNVIFFYYVRKMVLNLGYAHNGISQMLYSYYIIKIKLQNVGDNNIPYFSNILNRFVTVNSVLCLYIFLHNICFRKYEKKDLWLLLIILFWPVQSIIKSGRGDILILLAESIYLMYFFWNMYYGWNDTVNNKIIKWGSRIFGVFLILFIILAIVLGKRNSFAELNIKEYLTKYISVGIRNFDLFLKNPVRSDFFGQETFPGFHRILYNYLNIGNLYATPLEAIQFNGFSMGNIYTAFRRYYADFGLFGMLFISYLLGYFFSLAYEKIKMKSYKDQTGFRLLLFAYLSKEIFYWPIENQLLISELSIGGIFKIIMLYILYLLAVKKKVRIIIRRKL